jgi:hypothetical protein
MKISQWPCFICLPSALVFVSALKSICFIVTPPQAQSSVPAKKLYSLPLASFASWKQPQSPLPLIKIYKRHH